MLLWMGYLLLPYDTILPVKNNCFHPVTYGGDMNAFVSESTRLVCIVKIDSSFKIIEEKVGIWHSKRCGISLFCIRLVNFQKVM